VSPAGYSGKPLAQKLGIRTGTTVAALRAPAHYAALLGRLPAGSRLTNRLKAARHSHELIHCFSTSRRDLAGRLPRLERALTPAGALWISWPKQASGVTTDLTETAVREIGLTHGLVDVKVCAVDETWSGLKFVRRLRDR